MRDFATAFALLLVFEGCLYALFPEGMKRAAARTVTVPPELMRIVGLVAASAGLALVWIMRG